MTLAQLGRKARALRNPRTEIWSPAPAAAQGSCSRTALGDGHRSAYWAGFLRADRVRGVQSLLPAATPNTCSQPTRSHFPPDLHWFLHAAAEAARQEVRAPPRSPARGLFTSLSVGVSSLLIMEPPKGSVLLVEPNASGICTPSLCLLEQQGYLVHTADSAEAALGAALQIAPDVVMAPVALDDLEPGPLSAPARAAAPDLHRGPGRGRRPGRARARAAARRRPLPGATRARARAGRGAAARHGKARAVAASWPPPRRARSAREDEPVLRGHRGRASHHAAAVQPRDPGGAQQGHRAHPRRDRHRQGADRLGHPQELASAATALRAPQLRGAGRGRARVRAVRPREGLVHRAPRARARAASSRPTAARCSSTRSARSRPACR